MHEKRVLWYELEDGGFLLKKEKSGKLPSRIFTGLTLDVKALIKLDKAKVVKGLGQ